MYTCSKLSRYQAKKPAHKPENNNKNSSQVAEIVQVLSKPLVKLHISSTATQIEANSADKSTQTETNLLLEVKSSQRKNNRRCYKSQGAHLRKFCPLKNPKPHRQQPSSSSSYPNHPPVCSMQEQEGIFSRVAQTASPLQSEHAEIQSSKGWRGNRK